MCQTEDGAAGQGFQRGWALLCPPAKEGGKQGASLCCLETRPADVIFFCCFLLCTMSAWCLLLSCVLGWSWIQLRGALLISLCPCVWEEDTCPIVVKGCLCVSCPSSSLGWVPSTMHCFVSLFRLIKVCAALYLDVSLCCSSPGMPSQAARGEKVMRNLVITWLRACCGLLCLWGDSEERSATEMVTWRGLSFICDIAFPKSHTSLRPQHQTCLCL